MNADIILKHYLIAALWASVDDGQSPLDDKYSIEDISLEAKEKSLNDIKKFLEKAEGLLEELDDEQLGHDLFLTRNHHGAGFWDRDYEPYLSAKRTHSVNESELEKLAQLSKEKGDALTKIAHSLGTADFYVGDDQLIYC